MGRAIKATSLDVVKKMTRGRKKESPDMIETKPKQQGLVAFLRNRKSGVNRPAIGLGWPCPRVETLVPFKLQDLDRYSTQVIRFCRHIDYLTGMYVTYCLKRGCLLEIRP